MIQEVRRTRHDMKNNMIYLKELLNTDAETARKFLDEYIGQSEAKDEISKSGNLAVDALINYKNMTAREKGITIHLESQIPAELPYESTDLSIILGNLLENALHASQKLPPEQRRVQVMAQMLSPAMLGLVVENRYDGMLKKQQGILRSTKHEGTGIGLVSAETVVHKYNGNLHLETEEQIFRVNVLLNL